MELSLLQERLRPVGLSPAAAVALSDEILPFLAAPPRLPITPEQTEALAALLQSPKTLLIGLFPIPAETRSPADFADPQKLSIRSLTAPFAQVNYYLYITRQLKAAVQWVKPPGTPKSACRVFVNSSLPEKLLTLLSGLCTVGNNNLLLNPDVGSSFLVGGAAFPHGLITQGGKPLPFFPPEALQSLPPVGSDCGPCRRCINACPTGALRSDAPFQKESCLQYYSCREVPKPQLKRPLRRPLFYGCSECQSVCPFYRTLPEGEANYQRALKAHTPALPDDLAAADLLALPEAEAVRLLSERTRKTALSPKWLEKKCLIRNLKALSEPAEAAPPPPLPVTDGETKKRKPMRQKQLKKTAESDNLSV